MPADFDQCLEALNALIVKYSDLGIEHRNEATTRLQLIDELLFDCLGWDKVDCVARTILMGGTLIIPSENHTSI